MRRASVADTVRVRLSVLAPIVAQGVILRRPRMVALAARLATAMEDPIRDEPAHADRTGGLPWDGSSQLWWGVVRRTVLGHGARDDRPLIAMLHALRADANWAYLRPRREGLRRRLEERLAGHLERAEPDSLSGILARTPAGIDVDPAGQVPHWLFAFDAAGIAAYRSLALLALEPDAPVQAAVLESVRLWPTTMVILRDGTRAIDGVPAGSAYVIVTSYFQRDPDALAEPDRFTPELWLTGQAEDSWALMPFSRGPAMC